MGGSGYADGTAVAGPDPPSMGPRPGCERVRALPSAFGRYPDQPAHAGKLSDVCGRLGLPAPLDS